MMPATRALAVIIGRAGTKGLPGKNAAAIAGKPMICHSIDDAVRLEDHRPHRRVDRRRAIAAAAERVM